MRDLERHTASISCQLYNSNTCGARALGEETLVFHPDKYLCYEIFLLNPSASVIVVM